MMLFSLMTKLRTHIDLSVVSILPVLFALYVHGGDTDL